LTKHTKEVFFMRQQVFHGTGTALITPFHADQSIDFITFGKLIDYQIDHGIEALVVSGSTGESATLSNTEKCDLFRFAVEHVQGRVPIIAGTGSNNTAASVELTKQAKEIGVDAVLLVSPYYNKPTQQGIVAHHKVIAEVDIPQILYNVPGRTSSNLTAETQLQIAEECPNVIATKEASADLEQMMEIIRNAPEGFAVLSGDDSLTLPITACGGQGVIAVIPNYAPQQFGDLVRAALAGDFSTARNIQFQLMPLMKLNFIEANPVPVKSFVALQGRCEEYYRLPLLPIHPENREKLLQALQALG
jgi:4-hydroxy-tetrahydrodipicolinate synthase